MKGQRTRRASLTQRLADHVGRVTFALTAVVATEPDEGLDDAVKAEQQRRERAPKREAMLPAVRKLIAEGEALVAEHQALGRGDG